MVRLITLFIVLLMASVLQAQVLAVRTTERQCDQNSCRQFFGTGTCTYIGNSDGKSVYITAAHVVTDVEKIHVGYGGRWWEAIVKHKEQRYDKATGQNIDFAIIETRQIPSNKCMQLSGLFPDSGVRATAYGYSNGVYNLRGLPSSIYIRNNLRGVRDPVQKGDSGGPVVVDGKVVGVISSVVEDGKMTLCTPANLVRLQVKQRYRVFPCCNCSPQRTVVLPSRPIQPQPQPQLEPVPDNTAQVNALQGEVSRLREQLDQLKNTQIPVWVVDADGNPTTWKDEKGVEHENTKTYPLGEPIKIYFPGR
ncbi:trypsin-like peptidase domain-containing protein [Gimesia algae]|uniref:Serine protease n=1 Tax=Gimesia algae TaxID=2527971 RepID=A0A517VMN2_9PLAN|nr:trypsin-like peptidase domain-containing protein [Gimesia algae]QDT94278.1 hypothetical protein Pan161_59730 [Gimesia algae]